MSKILKDENRASRKYGQKSANDKYNTHAKKGLNLENMAGSHPVLKETPNYLQIAQEKGVVEVSKILNYI